MEEMFTAVEFIKRKSNSELSIVHFFEDKHGFGAAIKEDGFSSDVLQCLSTVTEFVSDDIYSNFSIYLKSRTVSIKTFTVIEYAKEGKTTSRLQIPPVHFCVTFFFSRHAQRTRRKRNYSSS